MDGVSFYLTETNSFWCNLFCRHRRNSKHGDDCSAVCARSVSRVICFEFCFYAYKAHTKLHTRASVGAHSHTHVHVMENMHKYLFVCVVYTHTCWHTCTHTHQQMINWGEIYLRSSGPPIEGWHGDISCCDLISCLLVWVPAGVRGGRSGTQEVTLAKSLKFSATWHNLAPGRALTSLTRRLKSTLKIK